MISSAVSWGAWPLILMTPFRSAAEGEQPRMAAPAIAITNRADERRRMKSLSVARNIDNVAPIARAHLRQDGIGGIGRKSHRRVSTQKRTTANVGTPEMDLIAR